jgi:hypothetical protein
MADESPKLIRLRFLNEQVLREQDIFWQRFYAFATVHAAGFVVFVSDLVAPQRLWVAFFGFLLGSIRAYTQWASLHYANRWKRPYHTIRKQLGLEYDHTGWFYRCFGGRRWASSTNAALATALLIWLLWIYWPRARHS